MPRKTDGVLFELQPRPTKGEDGKPLLYAQPVVEYKYDLDAIDNFCCKYRHTSKGEMKHFFSLLEEVTTMWLRQGDHPRMHRYRDGRIWHYVPVQDSPSL